MHDTNTPAELMQAQSQGSLSGEMGALGNLAPKSKEELQDWQDLFCEMAGVYIQCLDGEGVPITEFSGNSHEIDIIKKYVTPIRIHNICMRVCESDLEDQAVEITEIPNLRLAAVAVGDE